MLVEASGCGCPVICGNLAAVRDVIEDDCSGVLVNPNDSHALADAIIRLLADPQRRQRLADQARERCLNTFDWSLIATRYRELLLETSRPRH